MSKILNKQYNGLLDNIGKIIEEGRKKAYNNISNIIIRTYWGIGREIVEFEQKGRKRAEYGKKLLDKLCELPCVSEYRQHRASQLIKFK